jgi:putative nucleotidyltransferase with HDIG domain
VAAAEHGLALERRGDIAGAMAAYTEAIEAAERLRDHSTLAIALRRLAVLHHHANEPTEARRLAERSHDVALAAGDEIRAAEALNCLAGFTLERGDLETARTLFDRASTLGDRDPNLRGRVAQNLGIIANVHGDWVEARAHYERSLAAFLAAGDERGCAIAYHNLGMVSADHGDWDRAEQYLSQTHAIAARLGDVRLEGLARLNRAEVQLALGQADRALHEADSALRVFTRLGSELDKADSYRVIGAAYRQTGQRQLAEARLLDAVSLSEKTGATLSEAEAVRELSLLYHDLGRNQDALRGLTRAHRLFSRLDARHELVDVANKVRSLEDTYHAVVKAWGQSIESADSYTHGHCERVATFGSIVADAMAVDAMTRKTIRLGAYLHDLGKVKVPHEILNKPGRLTDEEFDVIKRHPVWGVELLAEVEFPWDLKPIIRWHHERLDGTGYPDRLAGDEIPDNAQVICIVDVWDALTTTRSYRGAMSVDKALDVMKESQHWWRPEVYRAFEATVPGLPRP